MDGPTARLAREPKSGSLPTASSAANPLPKGFFAMARIGAGIVNAQNERNVDEEQEDASHGGAAVFVAHEAEGRVAGRLRQEAAWWLGTRCSAIQAHVRKRDKVLFDEISWTGAKDLSPHTKPYGMTLNSQRSWHDN